MGMITKQGSQLLSECTQRALFIRSGIFLIIQNLITGFKDKIDGLSMQLKNSLN